MSSPIFIPQLRPCFWRQIYYFYYVAYFRSYSQAALALHITRPALSRAIQALEERLNTPLLVRTTRQVALTKEGKRILIYAQRALADFKKIECIAQERALDSAQSMRLFVPEPILIDYLMEALLAFQWQYPEHALSFYLSDNPEQGPPSGHLLQIHLGRKEESTWVQKPLLHFSGCLYASSDYLQNWDLPGHVTDLSDHRLLLLNTVIPGIFEDMNWHASLARDSAALAIHSVVHTPEHLITMAEAGFGIIAWIKDHPALKDRALEKLEDISRLHGPQRGAYFSCAASSFESEEVQALYLYLSQYAHRGLAI